jgi:hypothetical protein
MLPKFDPVEAPVIPKEETPKTDRELKLEAYLVKFDLRIKQWKEAHWRYPQIRDNPPIVWDSQINDYIWMNRSMRRP